MNNLFALAASPDGSSKRRNQGSHCHSGSLGKRFRKPRRSDKGTTSLQGGKHTKKTAAKVVNATQDFFNTEKIPLKMLIVVAFHVWRLRHLAVALLALLPLISYSVARGVNFQTVFARRAL